MMGKQVNWCCWRCGRWGTKQFMESYRCGGHGRMECSNDRACARRQRVNGKQRPPSAS